MHQNKPIKGLCPIILIDFKRFEIILIVFRPQPKALWFNTHLLSLLSDDPIDMDGDSISHFEPEGDSSSQVLLEGVFISTINKFEL